MTGIIKLSGLEFFAYHGFYDEEQKVGNRYNVDIAVTADLEAAATHDRLSETVNYEQLYAIVTRQMQQRARLLEHLANEIIEAVYAAFPRVQHCTVTITKFNPPLGGLCQSASVTLAK